MRLKGEPVSAAKASRSDEFCPVETIAYLKNTPRYDLLPSLCDHTIIT